MIGLSSFVCHVGIHANLFKRAYDISNIRIGSGSWCTWKEYRYALTYLASFIRDRNRHCHADPIIHITNPMPHEIITFGDTNLCCELTRRYDAGPDTARVVA